MTLPHERANAILDAKKFLMLLMRTASQGGFNGVPAEVRDRARRVLRHYPSEFDIHNLAMTSPEILQVTDER